jgi:6-phosphogluconolactonase
MYEVLGTSALATAVPWGAVDWFFGDERAVPFDHPDSNYRLAAETLFAGRPEALARAWRMPADAADAATAARSYGQLLPDPLDVMVLGMGEDGHTASLFPGSPALDESLERVVPVTGPKAPLRRMTITPRVIEGARDVLVLMAGAGKAAMLARALEGPLDVRSVPVQLARDRIFIVDAAAATALARP